MGGPSKAHAKVLGAGPIHVKLILLCKAGHEVPNRFFCAVFDSKVINDERETDTVGSVTEETLGAWALVITMFGEVRDKTLLR